MRILIIFLFIFLSFKSYAEGASPTSRYLMNDSFSMFEWGMLKLEEKIIDYVKKENQKARNCESDFIDIEKEKSELRSLLKKNYEDLTQNEKWDVDFFNNDEKFYQINCKHFQENGIIVGHYITYDFKTDSINIIFGQNYNRDTELKNFKKYYKKDNKESFYLSNEKCNYNRKRIVTGLFFVHPALFERMDGISDEEINNSNDLKYASLVSIFKHKYWINTDEPKDLASHLYNIIKVAVIVGEGFRDQKSIICWEDIKTPNPSYKIGMQPKIIAEFFNYDNDDDGGLMFFSRKEDIFFRKYD